MHHFSNLLIAYGSVTQLYKWKSNFIATGKIGYCLMTAQTFFFHQLQVVAVTNWLPHLNLLATCLQTTAAH